MKKTCLLCAKTFEAKRSDAFFCSNECKNKANYEKKRVRLKQIEQSQTDVPHQSTYIEKTATVDAQITLKGSLSIYEVRSEIEKAESKITDLDNRKKELNEKNIDLNRQIADINRKIRMIAQLSINLLKRRAELSDEQLYNLHLNKEYKKAKQDGEEYAHNKIITFHNGKTPNKCRLPIEEFRMKLADALERKNEELKSMDEGAEVLIKELSLIQYESKKNDDDVRFQQSRILKYESLLLSV